MTDRMTITAEPRTVTGKKVKQLRRVGYVPGVVYGQSEPVNVQMEEKELLRILRIAGTSQLATLDVEGREFTVLARDIQQHVTRRSILHIDFLEVDLKTAIRGEAELIAVGEAAPVAAGLGMTNLAIYFVEIEALPEDLIASIEVDLSAIEETSDTIHVSDLKVPDSVTIITDADTLVARFETARAELEEDELEDELGEFEVEGDEAGTDSEEEETD